MRRSETFWRVVVGLALFVLVGCGSSPAAPTPDPIVHANVVQTGNNQWVNCLPIVNTCTFQAEIRNGSVGGCAANVRGTTQFATAAGAVLGTFNWTGGGMLRPQETFVYAIPNVPRSIATGSSTFTTFPAWDDVRCS